jgi:ABC-type transporter lipoprotein component MlaA
MTNVKRLEKVEITLRNLKFSEAIRKYFDINEKTAEYLFDGIEYEQENVTPIMISNRIKRFLESKELT